jgi:chromosome segregation protein
MRLKHLSLVGYKTFADRAEFLFDEGITAIVGPNGSGKSNIADAVRWALGEQSLSSLRARKSEDMIFSGSERRARMGLAEVTITLDNSSHWLPVDFEEVAITRRAFRSGENECLLNGSRVRLRDITDLLGETGLSKRSYTVIGQGLIDTALSLRPQERRKLIEEAAGLTLYQARRTDALDKLEETRQNLLRVHDLISEIEPRLKRLARQAERANEYEQIRAELDKALRIWYSFQWKRRQDELGRMRRIAAYQEEQLAARRNRTRDVGDQIDRVRARQGELREQLGQWHRESSALHARTEAHQRELAVAEERRRGLRQRLEELSSEIVSLEANQAAQLEQIATAERALSELAAVLAEQQAAIDKARAAHEAWRKVLAELQEERDKTRDRLLALRTQIADHESRLAQIAERRGELRKARDAYADSIQVLQQKVRTLQETLTDLDAQLETMSGTAHRLETERAEREQEIATLHARQRDLERQRNHVDQRLARLRERREVLTRMREEGAGLYEGVRNILQARATHLDGIVGTVAELVVVPREWETAIEVALGGQLQDVVVETWEDAREAIAYLKRSRGGRATFLPLDTLRPSSPVGAPSLEGVLGIGSELVAFAPRLRSVVEHLLGRTIICRDLSVARRVLEKMSGSYQIVTQDGEQVRSMGAVTGGTRNRGRQSGMLARERELRELPQQLDDLERQRAALDAESADLARQGGALQDEIAVLDLQREKLGAAREETERERADARQQLDRGQSETEWHRSLVSDTQEDLDSLDEREHALRQGLADLGAQVGGLEAALFDLSDRIEQMDGQVLSAQLADGRAEAALTRQEQAQREAELRGYQHNLQSIERQIARWRQQSAEVNGQLERTEEQIAGLRARTGELASEVQSYAGQIEPAERALQELEGELDRLEAAEKQVRTRVQVYESRYSQVQLQVARQEEQMEHLRSQIEDDLGLVDLEMGEDLSGQPLLPIRPLVSSLPDVQELPPELEGEIRALKRRLHRLGGVNPDAPDEYQEVLTRYEFLLTQSQDLERAATQLREVIAELDDVMQREFKRTFDAVARAFKTYFSRLFDGGSARLQLTLPDDLMNTGIDIVARPPGKRQQGLAVLSGGERALTGAALIFGILSVSPTPFCVLDEVDAALDEANVGRFRSALRELSEQTQFVIITHNRYTIEVSDIVYGISMGADGASCVISHRLREEA